MQVQERNKLFQQALQYYQEGELEQSAQSFRLLLKTGSRNPRHISYCGLLVATAEGKFQDGLVLCELAVREAANDPDLFINLAKVHAWNGQPHRAIEVLRRALRLFPDHPTLLQEIQELSPRSTPPLFFLNRENRLNVYLGRTRARFSRRTQGR